jgi:hypothetical protein
MALRLIAALAVLVLLAATAGTADAAAPSYSAVRTAVAAIVPADVVGSSLMRYGGNSMGTACWAHSGCGVVGGCEMLDTHLPAAQSSTLSAHYSMIANIAVRYQRALMKLDYPRNVWGATLAAFESYEAGRAKALGPEFGTAHDDDELGNVPFEGAFSDRIQAELKAYQATHPSLHGLAFAGGCGADEISVKIVTAPIATQVFLIPSFYYELCRAENVDPDNTTACDHWREVLGPVAKIAGSYHYLVRWVGAVRRGVLDDKDYRENDDGYEVMLRKP